MKALLYLAIALALTLSPVHAAPRSVGAAEAIGYVDMERVFQMYKEAQKARDELKDKFEKYQKVVEKEQAKVEEARKKNRSEDTIKKMITDIQDKLKPQQQELAQFEAEQQRSLLNRIRETVKVVAKQYDINVVLDKQVVYVGGFDLTDFVIEKLNK